MKEIYFVRHGESEGNIGANYQIETTPLSPKGKEQAAYIAQRAKNLPIEAILASTMTRAQETAHAISSELGLPIESSDLFVERRRPVEQRNQPKDSQEAKMAEIEFIRSASTPGYHYSDEENFDDLKERAQAALALLESHPKDRLLVVTHGLYLRVLMAYAIFGEELNGHELDNMIGAFVTNNTGITVMKFDAVRARPWIICTWNDHAHLG